jgi:hypothetical protein
MARPRVCPTGSLIEGFLRERERATAREVAHGLQISMQDATLRLHRMKQSGSIAEVERVRVEHCKRPVAVYAPVEFGGLAWIMRDDWLR